MKKNITSEMVQAITKIAAATATETVIKKIKEEQERLYDTRGDRRRYNTKLLLRNYYTLREHAEHAVFEAGKAAEKDISIAEILDTMTGTFGPGKRMLSIESIQNSALKTKIIIKHIDEMLRIYESYAALSNKPEDSRRYEVVTRLYIKRDMSPEELASKFHVDIRTIYKDIDNAVEKLTTLIFGIDGIGRFEQKKGRKNEEEYKE